MRTAPLASLLLALLPGCRGAAVTPSAGTTVAIAPTTPATASSDRGGPGPGLPHVAAVMEDPRLADARGLEMARDYAGAALAVERARASSTAHGVAFSDACAWDYALGRLYTAAGDSANAAVAYDRVSHATDSHDAASGCALAAYANLRAATSYLHTREAATALERARAVPDDIALADEAHLTLANALADAGNLKDAIPLWRAIVAKDTTDHVAAAGPGWIDVACRLSAAWLDGADGTPASHASEALDLTTRVLTEAPKIEFTSGALALRARALALLPKASLDLTAEQREKRAKAWLDGGEAKKAIAEADSLLAKPGNNPSPSVLCNVSITRAQATARAKLPSAAEAWTTATLRCKDQEALVGVLYQGAKASVAKDPALALDRFAKVEKLFPAHRLADDARFQAALVVLGQGDETRFTSMMLALPDDYPEGDMRGEALFRVALLRMTKGDWPGASPLLDRIMSISPNDRHWATAGRAAYFRARAAQAAGAPEEALTRYERLIDEQPLAFYMTQAYARVAEVDPARARRAVDHALAKEESGPLLTHEHPELAGPAFERGLRLLEAGDVDAAKREILLSGVAGEGAEPETLWAVALLYNLGGAPEIGHAFARSRLTDYLGHYPAGRYKTMWQVAYPPAFAPFVESESRAHGIPVALTWAIMREESDFYPEAKSPSSAYGLMQLIASTARGLTAGTAYAADEKGLKRPDASIALGTKLLGGLRSEFAYNPSLAIAAYNGGGGAVGRWISARGDEDFDLWVEQIPWDETRGYVKRVLSSEAAYGLLYDHAALEEVLSIPRRAAGAAHERDAGSD
jgi:soluble lytic murein transglycosylase